MIVEPPLEAGAVHDTVAPPFPATPDTLVGAPGAVGAAGADGVTEEEGTDCIELPIMFTAITENV